MLEATTGLSELRGVDKRAPAFARAGLETVEDLLYHFPFRYEDRRAFARVQGLRPGGPDCTLDVRIASSRLIRTRRRGFTIFEAWLRDDSGTIKAIWYNQPYLARVLVKDRRVVFFGHATLDRAGKPVLENPDYEPLDDAEGHGVHTGRIVPVYRKVGETGSRWLRRLIHTALRRSIRPRCVRPCRPRSPRGMTSYRASTPCAAVHFPEGDVDLDALAERRTPAQRSLAFEEIFILQLALAIRRRGLHEECRGIRYEIPDLLKTRLAGMLPFRLTDAQKRVLVEIKQDLCSSHPMHRLLQGDVGSGKTIVALLTLLVAVENGYQAALMAPTEILAEQHARNIRALLDSSEIECRTALLTGSLRAPDDARRWRGSPTARRS